MPKRKVVQTVILYRNGERVKPPIGKIFDFTAEEVAQLAQVAPDALARPIVELDVENAEAQAKAKAEAEAQAKADADAQTKVDAPKAETKTGKGAKDKAAATDDEV